MPMFGRNHRGSGFSVGSQATEEMINIDYTNPETESTFAIFHQVRTAGPGANDANLYFAPYDTGGTPQIVGGLNTTLTSLYFARGWESFKFKMEAGFRSGSTGITYNNYLGQQAGNSIVALSGYGIAIQLEFPRPDSRWQWQVRTGIASGDNPQTQNYEGFYFSRNYDVAMLLFNHPMGQNSYDVLRTDLVRQRNNLNAVYSNDQTVDEDTVSNAIYLSPKFDYLINDKWEWNNTLTYAITQVNPSTTQTTGVGTDLGYEYDVGVTYKPHEKIRWINRLGIFVPGTVFKEGAVARDVNYTYGWETKAAISF